MAQRLPFHRSAKGTAPELVDCPPTVIHLWVVDRGAGPRVSGCGNSPVLAVLDGLHEAELVAAGGGREGGKPGGQSFHNGRLRGARGGGGVLPPRLRPPAPGPPGPRPAAAPPSPSPP